MSCVVALNNCSVRLAEPLSKPSGSALHQTLDDGFCQCFYEVSFDDLHFEAIPIVAPKIKAIEKNQTNI